jgi:hypothetical protein
MNERIEKLGEQADLLGEFTPTKIPGRYVGYITEEQILKFAQLIVKECMELVSATKDLAIEDGWNVDEAMSTAINDIEEHFGVNK